MKSASVPLARGLSRAQVAELLAISDVEVEKMHGRQLHPTRTTDRMWRYEIAEVRALILRSCREAEKLSEQPKIVIDGETTAKVFDLFDARRPLTKIVVMTRQPADVIMKARAQYDEMRGSLTLLKSAVTALQALLGQGFRTSPELLAATRSALRKQFDEGFADANEYGVVLNTETGQMRPVVPRDAPRRHEPQTSMPENAIKTAEDDATHRMAATPGAADAESTPTTHAENVTDIAATNGSSEDAG